MSDIPNMDALPYLDRTTICQFDNKRDITASTRIRQSIKVPSPHQQPHTSYRMNMYSRKLNIRGPGGTHILQMLWAVCI
ncbi:hypothetical protein T08_16780 [Trichinella sp. T8]|nr:hypothetical protein T08_16780 [Trichinella sp. T8]